MEGDEIRADFNSISEDIIEAPNNLLLDDVLDFYQCEDLLPLAQRIIWLSSIKEVLGSMPDDIPIDYEELRYLVALHEEQNKKMAVDNYKLKKDSERIQSSSDDGTSPILS
jgi:hypothetical protein